MRIVAGRWRGRQLRAPVDRLVRPTSDRVREAWMSIVHPFLQNATVLDLFAGTGALGLEALSRGAYHVDFVEKNASVLRVLRDNVAALDAASGCTVVRSEGLAFLRKVPAARYHVAFADPPYRLGLAEQVAEQWLEVPFADILGIEHERKAELPAGGETRDYGDTAITFYGLRPRTP
jgi:16S rRNA (guanine966-N2)-methyltransferase